MTAKKRRRPVLFVALAAATLSACSAKPASYSTPHDSGLHARLGARPSWKVIRDNSATKMRTQTSSTHRGVTADLWPTKEWHASAPEDESMDGEKLQAGLESARQQGLSLHGLIVVRHGVIVLEKYFPPYDAAAPHSLYSCTKSVVSALVGIAIKKGLIAGVDRPVMSFFPGGSYTNAPLSMEDAPAFSRQTIFFGISSPFVSNQTSSSSSSVALSVRSKHAITVENLLTMSSGLDWFEADETYDRMYSSSRDWVEFVLDWPMAVAPGQSFNYSSGNSHLLSAIIQKTSRMNTYEFACDNLFGPLGITDPDWERDPAGIPIGGWGLSLTPRDMAKLGYLYLHRGAWENKHIVSASWVHESTQPHIRADDNWQYGYQWWVDPSQAFFAAIGRYGQSIFVVPAQDLVVVFTAHIDSTDPEVDLLKKYIIPACI